MKKDNANAVFKWVKGGKYELARFHESCFTYKLCLKILKQIFLLITLKGNKKLIHHSFMRAR